MIKIQPINDLTPPMLLKDFWTIVKVIHTWGIQEK